MRDLALNVLQTPFNEIVFAHDHILSKSDGTAEIAELAETQESVLSGLGVLCGFFVYASVCGSGTVGRTGTAGSNSSVAMKSLDPGVIGSGP